MASAITGLNSNSTTPAASSQSTGSAGSNSPASLQNMFLQLFVAQLQNQDPLNPPQGTEFVSQLAQLTEVEQVTQINSSVGAIDNYLTTPAQAPTSTASNSTTPTTQPATS